MGRPISNAYSGYEALPAPGEREMGTRRRRGPECDLVRAGGRLTAVSADVPDQGTRTQTYAGSAQPDYGRALLGLSAQHNQRTATNPQRLKRNEPDLPLKARLFLLHLKFLPDSRRYQLPRSPKMSITLPRRSRPFSQLICRLRSMWLASPAISAAIISLCSSMEYCRLPIMELA